MDLRSHLEEIAGPVVPVADGQVDEDILRGRHAKRQRRTVQATLGAVFGAAALVAAFTVPGGGVGAGPQGPTAAAPPAAVTAVDLVAYQGTQPKGFTIDKVPAGWFIESQDDHGLVMAPERAKGISPSTDAAHAVPRILIMLESKDQNGPSRPGTEVTIGDRTGLLLKSLPAMIPGQPAADPDGDTGWAVWLEQPSGIWLIVQFDAGLGMGQDRMVELTSGVHVHPGALQGVG
ncbi:hypothetical protein Acsp01_39110 [Actinoplanes sp. NBRC 101535]|nr:hypothetical protein Acsp01_39110 [Actinoplanes sp. NBRC 101535]